MEKEQAVSEKIVHELDQNIKIEVNLLQKPIAEEANEEKEANQTQGSKTINTQIDFVTQFKGKLILHWSVYKGNNSREWNHPPNDFFPSNTKIFDNSALQTDFMPKEEAEEGKEGKENIETKTIQINITQINDSNLKNVINGMNYVFFAPETSRWYNNNNQNYTLKFNIKRQSALTSPNGLLIPDFVLEIIERETVYIQWTLMHRYSKCYDIMKTFGEEIPTESFIWLLIWLRFSFQRQLDWQRNHNTKPRDLSSAMSRLTNEVTTQYAKAFAEEKPYDALLKSRTSLIKSLLSQLGKGTGNGQMIRDEILHIMHRHRPKQAGDRFYEEWHQKLHNNTTPDDIIICEAVISFHRTGKIEDYWKRLAEGGITKEILLGYDRNITLEPKFQKHEYIAEFENFNEILKSVHSSHDLVMMYNGVKNEFGSIKDIDDIIMNKEDKDTIKQIQRIVQGRNAIKELIKKSLNSNDKMRELMFLEIALEMYARQLVEKIIHIKLDIYGYIDEMRLILQNIIISYPNYSELGIIFDDWTAITLKISKSDPNSLSHNALLKLKAVCGRISRLLTQVVDYFNINIDPRAKYLGTECNIDKFYVDLFAEEMIRGTIFFALSMVLKKFEPLIRKQANLGNWLIISRGSPLNAIKGTLIYVKALIDVQYEQYKQSTIIMTEKVNGTEEVPHGCIGIIMNGFNDSYPDILSHVSVRARNLNVLFSVCFDEKKIEDFSQLINKDINLRIQGQEIEWSLCNEGLNNNNDDKVTQSIKAKCQSSIVLEDSNDTFIKDIIELDDFDKKYVGAKSLNSKTLYQGMVNTGAIKYPQSFSLPFNLISHYLSLDVNANTNSELNNQLSQLAQETNAKNVIKILAKCKLLTMAIEIPETDEHSKNINQRLLQAGLNINDLKSAYTAIKSVWASKYNERVFLSTSKASVSLSGIRIAVLVQNIIQSDYAFVIHTKNPSTNNPNELYAEIVNGLGETLVGAYEGQSFSFIYTKDTQKYEIKSYQNKSVMLTNQGFIFRSDSNMEDLEGFSGAGLFDSVPLRKDEVIQIGYGKDELYTNEAFRQNMMEKIAMIGMQIEKLYHGVEQDIEGVYAKKEFYVVQTRPQV